jgi:glycosyltransferase involved in cell wall biosynthesis
MNPFITIVIPSYNHAHFLTRSLRSVLDQEYTNFEVLVVDNYSSDNTDEVVSSFKDDRIKLLKIHNEGVIAASRNLGIKYAQGDWIAFLDSDDIWYKTRLKTLINYLICDKYDVICTDEIIRNYFNNSLKLLRFGPYKNFFYETMLCYGNRLSTSATIVRKSFLTDKKLLFNESKKYITVEDYDLWLRLAKFNAKFFFLRKIEGEYFIHGANSSLKTNLHNNNLKILLSDHIDKLNVSSNKKILLFKKINLYLSVRELSQEFTNGIKIRSFLKLCLVIFSSPINSILIIYTEIIKRIRISISIMRD